MGLLQSIFGGGNSSFEEEMIETVRQLNLSLAKIQEGMRTYLQSYCKAHGIRSDTQTEEETFEWLISAISPRADRLDLAQEYVEILKAHPLVKQAFSTAIVFKINQLTANGFTSKAMELVDNLNRLGIPPYSLSLQMPNEKAFIAMANDFYDKSKTIVVTPASRGMSADNERYRIIKEIGRGGFGTVFLAHDNRLRRDVAIKRLNLDRSSRDELAALRMFEREAQIIAGLNHPNIIQVYDLEDAPDGYRIIMEYIEGESLEKYLETRGGQLPESEAVAIFTHICNALAYAHNKGVIHRDIKPANVFLSKAESLKVKVGDFGISVVLNATQSHGSHTIAGTKLYAAPEQYDSSKTLTPAADVYSATKVFYEMLTGNIGLIVDLSGSSYPEEYRDLLASGLAYQRDERSKSIKDLLSCIPQ
jgi:hypothetical protein